MKDTALTAELLSDLDKEWANVERLCGSLSEADMVARRRAGDWSVKDTICHLSAWEKYLLDRLGYVLSGQKPMYPAMSSMDDVHRFNAQVYAENKDRPLNSVIIEFRSLYRVVMTVLEALNDAQLSQPYSYDFPDDHLTLLQIIRANTYEHFREHCSPIQKDK